MDPILQFPYHAIAAEQFEEEHQYSYEDNADDAVQSLFVHSPAGIPGKCDGCGDRFLS